MGQIILILLAIENLRSQMREEKKCASVLLAPAVEGLGGF